MITVTKSRHFDGPTLAVIELKQMLTQATFANESAVRQLPGVDTALGKAAKQAQLLTLADWRDAENAAKVKGVLEKAGVTAEQKEEMTRVANVVSNAFSFVF
jgi:hypothetical protein